MDSPPPNPAALDPVAVSESDSAGPGQGLPSHLSPPPFSVPPQIPDYELLRRIGSGSYGEVWLARNVLGQCRAVKIIYRSRFVDPRPFEREFEGIQRFEPISRSHPSQLHILHVGKNEAGGCFYYVMELADDANAPVATNVGSSLLPDRASSNPQHVEMKDGLDKSAGARSGEACAAGDSRGPRSEPPHVGSYKPRTLRHDLERHCRLPIPDCVQIGLSLATALAHLHEQGLVHRDIKPSNIIFVNGSAKLGDIGLVTEAGDTQSIVGTEGYLPPEGPGTPQADLFSLGKVLYEISTGMDRRRFAELPDDLREWPDRNAVVEFNEVVLKACAKDPAQRYQIAKQLQADLALLQTGKSVRRTRRNQWLWSQLKKVSIGLVLLALVIAGAVRMAPTERTDIAEGGPPSTNEQANAFCNKALMNLRADNQRGFPEVYTNLHRAIGLDTNFARPYVGLLELVLRESIPGVNYPPSENERTITQRLVELAPDSAAAHCGQAILAYYDLDFPSAEQHIRRTIQIDPDYELGHTWYGFMLENWMRPVEARQQLEIARTRNRFKVQIYRCLAHTYYVERNFPRAIDMYREGIGWEPHDLPCYVSMGRAYRAMGDYLKAIEVIEEMERVRSGEKPQPGGRLDQLRQAFVKGGERGYWEEEWRQPSTNWWFTDRAEIQIHLGNIPEALKIIEESYESHERYAPVQSGLPGLLFCESSDKLRDEPRFQALVEKIGFNKVNPKLKE